MSLGSYFVWFWKQRADSKTAVQAKADGAAAAAASEWSQTLDDRVPKKAFALVYIIYIYAPCELSVTSNNALIPATELPREIKNGDLDRAWG